MGSGVHGGEDIDFTVAKENQSLVLRITSFGGYNNCVLDLEYGN